LRWVNVGILAWRLNACRRKKHDWAIERSDRAPITLKEAVLGARVKAPTPSGPLMLTAPKGSNAGTILRLRGKGVARAGRHGDELVTLKVMLPPQPDRELKEFLSRWTSGAAHDPRKDMPT